MVCAVLRLRGATVGDGLCGQVAFTRSSICEADDRPSIRVSMMRFGLTGPSAPHPD
ncbi:type III secretion protein HrpB2 [Burkholderia pseudomallei 305]|nr:type III secretion protein HrpB2 [Burkholderia pseudomallei 305]